MKARFRISLPRWANKDLLATILLAALTFIAFKIVTEIGDPIAALIGIVAAFVTLKYLIGWLETVFSNSEECTDE